MGQLSDKDFTAYTNRAIHLLWQPVKVTYLDVKSQSNEFY